jgi:hypothetical protein
MELFVLQNTLYTYVVDSHETWKCVEAELQRQIRCFPYVEFSDAPRLQQVKKKSRRTAEESRITGIPSQESERSCTYLLEVPILHLSTICQLDLGTVPC